MVVNFTWLDLFHGKLSYKTHVSRRDRDLGLPPPQVIYVHVVVDVLSSSCFHLTWATFWNVGGSGMIESILLASWTLKTDLISRINAPKAMLIHYRLQVRAFFAWFLRRPDLNFHKNLLLD